MKSAPYHILFMLWHRSVLRICSAERHDWWADISSRRLGQQSQFDQYHSEAEVASLSRLFRCRQDRLHNNIRPQSEAGYGVPTWQLVARYLHPTH